MTSLEEAGIYLSSSIEKNIREPIDARIHEIIQVGTANVLSSLLNETWTPKVIET